MGRFIHLWKRFADVGNGRPSMTDHQRKTRLLVPNKAPRPGEGALAFSAWHGCWMARSKAAAEMF
jgi:hypothetical protein